jgi:hypothetical protein
VRFAHALEAVVVMMVMASKTGRADDAAGSKRQRN